MLETSQPAVKVEILEQVPCAVSCDFSKLPQALICAGAVFLFSAVLGCVTAVSAADRDLAVSPVIRHCRREPLTRAAQWRRRLIGSRLPRWS
jgi:hypothetical protein